jgi:hypothetical protein
MCARIKQGILGGFSGAVANIVGTSWKGIAVMKSKPLSVANPKTAGQVSQRGKFSNVVSFAQLILSTVIKPLWDRFASQQSGFNEFIQVNIDLFDAAMPSPVANLIISKGKMESTIPSSAVYDHSDKNIIIQWPNDSGEGFKLATDAAYIVALNVTKGEVAVDSSNAIRSDAGYDFQIDGWDLADVKHLYLAFRRSDGTIVSNTGYKIVTNQA